MAKFLTTSGINYVLEEIIKTARERLVLISPYLKLNTKVKELLGDRYNCREANCARRGSNPQPLAPEANALSS